MILTTLNSIRKYQGMNTYISDVLEFIHKTDVNKLVNGKLEIKEDDLFAIVMRPDNKKYKVEPLEAHKKYIDIHWVIKGSEQFGWKDISQVTDQRGEFNEKDDYVLHDDTSYNSIQLKENDMAIVFPDDAHAPSLETIDLFKVVFKLKV